MATQLSTTMPSTNDFTGMASQWSCGLETSFQAPTSGADVWSANALGGGAADLVECLQRALLLDMPQQQQSPLSSPPATATGSPSWDFLSSSLGLGQQELPSSLTAQRLWGNDCGAAGNFADQAAFSSYSFLNFPSAADRCTSSAGSSLSNGFNNDASSSGGSSNSNGGSSPQRHQMQMDMHMQQQPQQQAGQRRRLTQRNSEGAVRRTVYVSCLNAQITEATLALFFESRLLGSKVVDCRVCGEPNSITRFAFVEFAEEASAFQALAMTGCILGSLMIRVMPSKTAIVPVNQELMPQTPVELERCLRTVYVSNIDKGVDKAALRAFFEQICGPVVRMQQHGALGNHAAATRIAFVEFAHPEGALAALGCTGATLGARALRCFPSKTPVRSKGTHSPKSMMA